MLKSSIFEKDREIEENIIKLVRNFFRLKDEIDDITIKDIRNLFRLKEENETIKHAVIRDVRNLSEHEEKHYYKPHCVKSVQIWSFFWSVFSCIQTEYGDLCPYSVRIQENTV